MSRHAVELVLQVERLEYRRLLSAALVADIIPGPFSSEPSGMAQANGTLYFGARGSPDSNSGLWKSDGTAAGTQLVADNLVPGIAAVVGDRIFFRSSAQLWTSDGTSAGTIPLGVPIFDPGWSDTPVSYTAVGDRLFFNPSLADSGRELWVSDGTPAGTELVKDIYPNKTKGRYKGQIQSSRPASLTNFNGTLFFSADDGVHGRELWKSDGKAAGTVMVKDIATARKAPHSGPDSLTVVNGVLYFSAFDGLTETLALWKSDGTDPGTVLVKQFPPTTTATFFTAVDDTLFFRVKDRTSANDGDLWKSDGTAAGTVMVKDIDPLLLTNVNNTLFFTANDGVHGNELWKSDGTEAGTVMVRDDTWPLGPSSLTNVNGLLYFVGNDGIHGSEVWQSDGTEAGTILVQDINPGSEGSLPRYLTAMNGSLYFSAYEPTHGEELWRASAPEPALSIAPAKGPSSSLVRSGPAPSAHAFLVAAAWNAEETSSLFEDLAELR